MSKVIIKTATEDEIKTYSRRILYNLLKCLSHKYEIHGYGKKQVQGAERLCKALYRYIVVEQIQSGFFEGDCYIIIIFTRQADIHKQHRMLKKKIEEARVRRRRMEELEKLRVVQIFSPVQKSLASPSYYSFRSGGGGIGDQPDIQRRDTTEIKVRN